MRTWIACVALALSAVAAAEGEVVVEILNMPSEVYSFEPVYVLYSVENTGRAPLHLPAAAAPNHGVGVYFAAAGKQPGPWRGRLHEDSEPRAAQAIWLAPGERWLFYQNIGSRLGVLEGEIAVQAVMSSDGLCSDRQYGGRHQYPGDHIGPEVNSSGYYRGELYRCWQGEARSTIWTVTVRRSQEAIDRAAREYLVRERAITHDPETGAWSLRWAPDLRTKYSASHYAYAVDASSGMLVGSWRMAVAAQPDNPLNPWVMGAIAQEWLDRKSSCWLVDPSNPKPGRPGDFEVPFDDLALPTGVPDYLEQHRWWLEHRHCPAVLVDNKKRQRGAQP